MVCAREVTCMGVDPVRFRPQRPSDSGWLMSTSSIWSSETREGLVIHHQDIRRILASGFVPILMVLVAAYGTWNHVVEEQTAWRGATGGMFSRIDGPGNRLLVGVVDGQDPMMPGRKLSPPIEVQRQSSRSLVRPSASNLSSLAADWADHLDAVRLVRLEVWTTRFDRDRAQIRLELVRAFDVDRGVVVDQ